ncbi:class I adenylate-forming enzyme family protein [Alkalihalophilus pseudofirmus]|uniref:class I adenylate-forming enzyme family protein n=1 Tax=Alkalihalophilus pseudofirmus TaxID=79885 RepID=UPI00259B8141|nr:class I adenylate-forming enzyme family protein [Alkalihalophilus pseudofirmus]WEG15200.1 class I adenylate-forming enzyme family protein [Alkalihalophilus pseudofirmus]
MIEEITLYERDHVKVFSERPKNLTAVLQNSVRRYKDRKAIVTEDQTYTYEELDTLSSRIASNLQQDCKVERGDRVAAIIGNRSEFPLVVLACAKIGAILVPVNVKLTSDEMSYILGHSEVKVVISEEKHMNKLEEVRMKNAKALPNKENIFEIEGVNSFTRLLEPNSALVNVVVDELDPLFILYTSGTTGRPKGAVITHINVIHSLLNYQRTFQTNSQTTTLIAVPMFHVTGLVGQLLHMIYVGGTCYTMDRYQNRKYIKYIQAYKINFLFNVPTIFLMMSTEETFRQMNFDFVTKVAFGGSPIYQQTFNMLKEAFPHAELHNAYGATETTSPATLMPITYDESKVTSVGRSVPVGDIKIMNANGEECALEEVGELYIKGPMVIKEYWKNPEANEINFTDGYWHSGDLGMMDRDGFIYIRDRIKDMINHGGEKIFSIEVEDALKKHELIKEAAVIGIPDTLYGEKVKAYIVSDHLTADDVSLIKSHCSQYLAKYKVPEVYRFVSELPKNASGKIMKHALKTDKGELPC